MNKEQFRTGLEVRYVAFHQHQVGCLSTMKGDRRVVLDSGDVLAIHDVHIPNGELIESLESRIAELESVVDQKENRICDMRELYHKKEDEMKSRIADLEQELSDSRHRRAKLERCLDDMTVVCGEQEKRIADLEQQLAESIPYKTYRKIVTGLNNANESYCTRIAEQQSRITILESALREATTSFDLEGMGWAAEACNKTLKQNENESTSTASVCNAQQLPHTD